MATKWTRHDDSTEYFTLGGVLMVAVVYDRMGDPGWKVQVGKRSLRDKLASKEDAQRVAVAYAEKILRQCDKELVELKVSMG